MQHFKSSYLSSLSETPFFFPLLDFRTPYFFTLVRCFKAPGEPNTFVQTVKFFTGFWIKIPTHGHIDSVSFRGLRRWPHF